MAKTPFHCTHCNADLPARAAPPPRGPQICDGCVESIRTTRRPLAIPGLTPTGEAKAKASSKGKKKTAAAAVALVLFLAAAAGCTMKRTTTLDVEFHRLVPSSAPTPTAS
jgi:hypothetical protein